MRNSSRPAVVTNIRVAALRAGVSQNDIAEMLGVSQPALSRRMTGDVDFRVAELVAIADYLGVTVDQLLEPAAEQATA